jgi:FMN phosphatase YigB (HAD superfamily)
MTQSLERAFTLVYGLRVLPLLVLDFDGTVCLGDGPVWAYADAAVRDLDDATAAHVTAGLRRHLDGAADGFSDGYAAVAAYAGPYVSPDDLQRAYAASREALAGATLDIVAPAGLAEFLTGLAGRARRVLVTNAPPVGIPESLATLRLTDCIDDIHTEARKPAGLTRLLPELLDGAPPASLMSIGDVWVNDIEPALAIGAATAYIARDPHDGRPAHLRATHLSALYPAISAWVADPADLPHAHVRTPDDVTS